MARVLLELITTLGGLYLLVALLRVMLQVLRVDYYNPVSQVVIRITDVPVRALQTLLPTFKNVDLAALLWVLIVEFLFIELIAIAVFRDFVSPFTALAWAAVGVLGLILTTIYWCLIIVVIVSFVRLLGGMPLDHPVIDLVHQIVEPLSEPIRRFIPPVAGLDFSVLVLFLLVQFMRELTYAIAISVSLAPDLVIGI